MALTKEQTAIAEAIFAASYGVSIGKRAGEPTHVPVDMASMPQNAWLKIVSYGVQRTFNDMIGGSDTDVATKVAQTRDNVAEYLKGNVGRQAASRATPLEVAIRNIMRKLVTAKMDKEAKKAWDALEADERNAQLDALFAKQAEPVKAKLTKQAQKDVEEAQRRAEEAKALGTEVTLDL